MSNSYTNHILAQFQPKIQASQKFQLLFTKIFLAYFEKTHPQKYKLYHKTIYKLLVEPKLKKLNSEKYIY